MDAILTQITWPALGIEPRAMHRQLFKPATYRAKPRGQDLFQRLTMDRKKWSKSPKWSQRANNTAKVKPYCQEQKTEMTQPHLAHGLWRTTKIRYMLESTSTKQQPERARKNCIDWNHTVTVANMFDSGRSATGFCQQQRLVLKPGWPNVCKSYVTYMIHYVIRYTSYYLSNWPGIFLWLTTSPNNSWSRYRIKT